MNWETKPKENNSFNWFHTTAISKYSEYSLALWQCHQDNWKPVRVDVINHKTRVPFQEYVNPLHFTFEILKDERLQYYYAWKVMQARHSDKYLTNSDTLQYQLKCYQNIIELGIDFALLNSTKLLLVEGVFGKQHETSTWEQQSASCNICAQMKVIQYIKKTLYCTNRCTQSINPFTSKILFLILLTLCHTLLIMIL